MVLAIFINACCLGVAIRCAPVSLQRWREFRRADEIFRNSSTPAVCYGGAEIPATDARALQFIALSLVWTIVLLLA